jgi:hypoxanthine-DNA glycosylase
MDGILQELTPANLTSAIVANLVAFIPIFGKLGQAHLNNPVGVNWSITDIPVALFNSVMDARLSIEDVDATIRFILVEGRRRNVPMLWWIGPATRPVDLAKYLEKYGFTPDEESPGMAVELVKMNENIGQPAGLSIQLAQDEASWLQWSQTMAAGFEIPAKYDFVVTAWKNLISLTDPQTTQAYLGWLDGKPVATSLLFLGGGVAGIYAVATIPEARRKGIGAWMTLYPLLQARAMGYKAGVLGASEMGEGIYRSLGFQEYCRISEYRWQPTIETHPFDDFAPQEAQYLILGSFTGKQATQGFPEYDPGYDWYYGTPRNQFWRILEAVYDHKLPDKQSKQALFTQEGIAITDIIHQCERKKGNNLDGNLTNIVYNVAGIANILDTHSIRKIFFTSRFVENQFKRAFKEMIDRHPEYELVTLPSPSPRYARMSLEQKIIKYKELLPMLVSSIG